MDKRLNILLATMSMEIGGAETHILELAIELKRRGYNVIVASNGGVYVQELLNNGITHYDVPLYNKNAMNIAKSYFLLKRIIKEEKIDVVHGHARIPSFILGLIHKTIKFPFVTTSHAVFRTNGIFKYTSNWGQKTISVSEDIKSYLIDNYAVNPKDVSLTINGINTDKFSPDIDDSSVCNEFELTNEKRRIIYVSRMDDDSSLIAFHLVEIAKELNDIIDNLEIVIVGGGNYYDDLADAVKKVNAEIGMEVIKLTGARVDINKFIKSGEIFVGVSRAVLEAMAVEKPVIVAGNRGYIGILDEDKLPICISSNFTCRQCPAPTTQKLFDDIQALMVDYDDEKLKSLAKFNRQTILDKYSVYKMAQDNIDVYMDALRVYKDENDIVLLGYYGFENSGDDSLLRAILDDIKSVSPTLKVCVMSKNPKKTREHYDAYCINRFNPFTVMNALRNTKALVVGGGSLIQDYTSTESLFYYIAVIKLAIKFGAKTMLYANGIGPLLKEKNIIKAKNIIEKIDVITLREPDSLEMLKNMGVENKNIIVTADPAFGLKSAHIKEIDNLLMCNNISKILPYYCVSIRNWKNFKDEADFASIMASKLDYISKKYGLIAVFLPMQLPNDIAISQNIMSLMESESRIISKQVRGEEIMAIMKNSTMTIAMRLHSLIYAAAVQTPILGIVYDPKIKGIIDYIGIDSYIDINNVGSNEFEKMADDIMEKKPTLSHEQLDVLSQKARVNAKIAVELIGTYKNNDEKMIE